MENQTELGQNHPDDEIGNGEIFSKFSIGPPICLKTNCSTYGNFWKCYWDMFERCRNYLDETESSLGDSGVGLEFNVEITDY